MIEQHEKKVKIEIYNDHFENAKRYGIQHAQLIVADIPYNLGNNAYASNLAGKSFFDTDNDFKIHLQNLFDGTTQVIGLKNCIVNSLIKTPLNKNGKHTDLLYFDKLIIDAIASLWLDAKKKDKLVNDTFTCRASEILLALNGLKDTKYHASKENTTMLDKIATRIDILSKTDFGINYEKQMKVQKGLKNYTTKGVITGKLISYGLLNQQKITNTSIKDYEYIKMQQPLTYKYADAVNQVTREKPELRNIPGLQFSATNCVITSYLIDRIETIGQPSQSNIIRLDTIYNLLIEEKRKDTENMLDYIDLLDKNGKLDKQKTRKIREPKIEKILNYYKDIGYIKEWTPTEYNADNTYKGYTIGKNNELEQYHP